MIIIATMSFSSLKKKKRKFYITSVSAHFYETANIHASKHKNYKEKKKSE